MHAKILQRTDVHNPITYDCFSDLLDRKSPPLHIKICTLRVLFCFFFSCPLSNDSGRSLPSYLELSAVWQSRLVHSLNPAGEELVPFSPSATSTLNLVGCKHLFQNESHPLQSAGCHYVPFQNIMLLP